MRLSTQGHIKQNLLRIEELRGTLENLPCNTGHEYVRGVLYQELHRLKDEVKLLKEKGDE